MEREPQGGSDFGQDLARDVGDGARRAARRRARPAGPDRRVRPGQRPRRRAGVERLDRRDARARLVGRVERIIFPALRPVGTQGLTVADVSAEALAADATTRQHSQPIVDEGPCGIPVVYALHAGGFDVIVNADHVLSWGVGRRAAPGRRAPQPRRVVGRRRLDRRGLGRAAADLVRHRRGLGRVADPPARGASTACPGSSAPSVGSSSGSRNGTCSSPARLRPSDDDFAALFAEFVVEQSGGSDEPIDRRVFELSDGRLVEFAATPTPA